MKAKRLVCTTGMSREDWLRYRRMGIGGSDAPAICGLSRWGNPLSVYLDKVSTEPPGEEENRFQYWGKVVEPLIAEEFARQSGLKVRNCNFILQHPKHPFLLANIDREVLDPDHGRVGLECKQASQYKAKEWADGQTPEEYIVQCSHYMMTTDSPLWYLAVLIGGNDFEWRKLTRDLELEEYLFKLEFEFWQMVQAKTPPALTEDGRMVGLHFKEDPPRIILPDDLAPKVAKWKELDAQIKPLTKERDAIKDELHQIMEVADPKCEAFLCGDYQLSRKIVSTMTFDTKAFREEHPELYEGYLAERIQRRFGVK